MVKPNPTPIKFVSFPGADIQDLYVHEVQDEAPAAAPGKFEF